MESNPYQSPSPWSRSETFRSPNGKVSCIRLIAVIVVVSFGTVIALHIRGLGVGFSPLTFVCSIGFLTVLVGIPAYWLLQGIAQKTKITAACFIVLVGITVAETRCGIEESRFVQNCRRQSVRPPGWNFKSRRWPNQNGFLMYDPQSGELIAGD